MLDSPGSITKSSLSNPDQSSLEVSSANAQDEPEISENENPVADANNHESRNFKEAIHRGIQESTGTDSCDDARGPSSTGEEEQSNEDKIKELNAKKAALFDSMASTSGVFVPILAIVFGFLNIGECPANLYMPYMVFVIGLLSLFIAAYTDVHTSSLTSEGVIYGILGQNERMVVEISFWLFACLWLYEFVSFFFMEVSFDSSADNYCDYSFHTFTLVMNIFALLASAIGWELLYNTPKRRSCQDYSKCS